MKKKVTQTIVIESAYGKISTFMTVVDNLRELFDDEFPGFRDFAHQYVIDGDKIKRIVNFKDGSFADLTSTNEQASQKFLNDSNAIGYSVKGGRLERSTTLTDSKTVTFVRKFNDMECYNEVNGFTNGLSGISQIIHNHLNFKVISTKEE